MLITSILTVHIIAATIALFATPVALSVIKGSRWHKLAGRYFSYTMMIMAISAMPLAIIEEKYFDALSGVLTLYLIATALYTFRPDNSNLNRWLTALAGTCIAGYLSIELIGIQTGIRHTDAPSGAGFVFATLLAMSIVGDFRRRRNGLSHSGTLVRHLWRMHFALLMATASFFGARPHLFPEWMQQYQVLLALSVAPIILMAYWTVRIRLTAKAA